MKLRWLSLVVMAVMCAAVVQAESLVPCMKCQGKKTMDVPQYGQCQSCQGRCLSNRTRCSSCKGSGEYPYFKNMMANHRVLEQMGLATPLNAQELQYMRMCPSCQGSGMGPCTDCHMGFVMYTVRMDCSWCQAKGWVTQEHNLMMYKRAQQWEAMKERQEMERLHREELAAERELSKQKTLERIHESTNYTCGICGTPYNLMTDRGCPTCRFKVSY